MYYIYRYVDARMSVIWSHKISVQFLPETKIKSDVNNRWFVIVLSIPLTINFVDVHVWHSRTKVFKRTGLFIYFLV